MRQYYSAGFMPLKSANNVSIEEMDVAASTTISKGVVIGYSTGAVELSAFDATARGVSSVEVDNSAGSLGTLKVPFIPLSADVLWIVPVASVLITADDIGKVVDITTGGGSVLISDTSVVAYGFQIENIDVSAEAIAVNTYGFAIGRFKQV